MMEQIPKEDRRHLWQRIWKRAAKKWLKNANSVWFDFCTVKGMYEAERVAVIDAEATANKRKELLRRCQSWLESYLEYLDTDIPITGEPNNSVAKLIEELAKELDDD